MSSQLLAGGRRVAGGGQRLACSVQQRHSGAALWQPVVSSALAFIKRHARRRRSRASRAAIGHWPLPSAIAIASAVSRCCCCLIIVSVAGCHAQSQSSHLRILILTSPVVARSKYFKFEKGTFHFYLICKLHNSSSKLINRHIT